MEAYQPYKSSPPYSEEEFKKFSKHIINETKEKSKNLPVIQEKHVCRNCKNIRFDLFDRAGLLDSMKCAAKSDKVDKITGRKKPLFGPEYCTIIRKFNDDKEGRCKGFEKQTSFIRWLFPRSKIFMNIY